MLESRSTETLINSFPMFGHPGISALEYAGTLAGTKEKKSRSSVTSASLKRKSTAETHSQNTRTLQTADTGPFGTVSPLAPVHYIDEFGTQRKRKDMFVNHTPRSFDMPASHNIEVYRPSTSSSSENYSRPRVNSQNSRSSSAGPHTSDKRLTVNHGAPIELDSTEVGIASSPLMAPEVYRPMAAPHRRSVSSPMTKIITYQPRQARAIISKSHQKREVRVRSTSTPNHDQKEKKQTRRQTPYAVTSPEANISAPYASLGPWVAKHERNATSDTNSDKPTQEDLEKLEEVAPLGVIQKYFDSQADSRESSLRRLRLRHTPSPPKMPLPSSPDPSLRTQEPVVIFPLEDLRLSTDIPPAVPERSPKRLTNPRLPFRKESVTSVDSDFARAAEGQFSEYDQRDEDLRVPKKRSQRCGSVGQAARAGSSNLGRMAPPILGHDALTASSYLGLNDLSYYLKHTGPRLESQASSRQRARSGPKIFKVKRKSLAARVGSVEGSPQRARQQKSNIPTCAREMITSGGAKHLKIIIPRLSGTDTLNLPVAFPTSVQEKHISRHMSLSFTEEMLAPLASPAVERAIHGFSSYDCASRSFSAPHMVAAANAIRKEKSPPISPKPVPVLDHPLSTRDERTSEREQQTKARKLRDLNKIKRKEIPSTPSASASRSSERQSEPGPGALPTPRHTPEPGNRELADHVVHEESANEKMARLQERVLLLQRQNTELVEGLARVLGLEDGDLDAEFVLKTFRRCRHSRTPSGW